MGDLLATLRNRNFALLWSGGLISMTGDWMLLVALPIYVYQATGSALATGAMFAAGLLPNVLFGLVGVVAVDAASYLVSAALVSLISAPAAPERPEEAPPADAGGVAAAFSGVWREWAEGLRLVGTGRVILTVFVVGAVTGLGEGVFLALFPPFVRVALGGGALELGWLMSAQAVGGVLGGLVVGAAAARLSSSRLLGLGAVLFGLIDLTIFVYPSFVQSIGVGLALFVLVGIPAAGVLAGLQTLLQTSAEDRFRGRVFGALGTTQALLMLAGTLLGGALGDAIGIVPVLVVQGGAYVAAGILVLVLLAHDGKRAVRGGV
jgi:hypothetical protein